MEINTKFDTVHDLHKLGTSISREAEIELFTLYKNEVNFTKKQQLKDRIVKANMRFAMKVALSYKNVKGVDINDIVAEALCGLVVAIDKYSLDKDIKFISYAVWHIKDKVLEYLNRNELIHVPSTRKAEYLKARKTTDEMSLDLQNISNVLNNTVSIYAPVNGEEELSMVDTLPDDTLRETYTEKSNLDFSSRVLEQLFNGLTNDEVAVVKALYGLEDEWQPLNNVAICMGRSREYIRQCRNRGIDKMRKRIGNILEYKELIMLA